MKFYSFWSSLAAFRVRIAMNIKGIVPDEVVNIASPDIQGRRYPDHISVDTTASDQQTILASSLHHAGNTQFLVSQPVHQEAELEGVRHTSRRAWYP